MCLIERREGKDLLGIYHVQDWKLINCFDVPDAFDCNWVMSNSAILLREADKLSVFSALTGQPLCTHKVPLFSLCFSGDRRLLHSGGCLLNMVS
jgi:hypothetical protein